MLFLPARSALFVVFYTAKALCADPIYKPVGDSVVLNPGPVLGPISSVTWKQEPDLALEWDGLDVICYRDFKGRCSLNKKDGSLTISNLTVEDSGIYTPQINNKLLNQLELRVLKPVPKPLVSIKCNNEQTLCYLTCEANISPDVGTVTYEWRNGDVVLSNDKELILTTENEENSFICELENRVSSSSSDGADNPISRGNPGAAWAGLAGAILALIVVLAVAGRFLYYKCKKKRNPTWKEFWCCDKNREKGQYTLVSGQEPNTSNNHELNGGWPTDTVQIISENASEKPKDPDCDPPVVSAEPDQDSDEGETFYDAPETFTSRSTEKNNLQSSEGANQNLFSLNPVTSGSPEDEASPRDNKETGDQDKESAEDPSSENQGKSDQARNSKEILPPNIRTEDEASPGGEEDTDDQHKEPAKKPSSVDRQDSSPEEKTETSNLDSTEGANWKTPPVIQGTRDPTGNSPVEPSGPETSEPSSVI